MDKINKALNKLSLKERRVVKVLLEKIGTGTTSDLDVKKLKGRDDIFRVRKGKLRIIYRKKNERIFILAIERRNDTTYT